MCACCHGGVTGNAKLATKFEKVVLHFGEASPDIIRNRTHGE